VGGIAQIFWDIENCAVPHAQHPAMVVRKLRSLKTPRGYSPSRIVAAGTLDKLPVNTREGLVASGVDLLDCSSSKPSASDFLLLEEIQRWTFFHPPHCSGIM